MKKILILFLIVMLLGCSQNKEKPFYIGEITSIFNVGWTDVIMVSGYSEFNSFESIAFVIKEDTLIINYKGKDISLKDLEKGKTVEVWVINDEVIETETPQAIATKIIVKNK